MNVRLYDISIKCVLAIILSALFASCKDEDEEYKESSSPNDGKIGFNAFQDGFQKPTTRATLLDEGDLTQLSVLSMKKGNGSAVWKAIFGTNEDEEVVNLTNTGVIWEYSPLKYWEEKHNYRFKAYYPNTITVANSATTDESCGSGGFTHENFSSGSTTLKLTDYRSADDPRNNTDLLVSDLVECSTMDASIPSNLVDETVRLNMKHILACVNFNIKKKIGQKLTITSFQVVNYVNSGDYNSEANPNWRHHQTFTASELSENFFVLDNNGNTIKPQNLNNGHLKKGFQLVAKPRDIVGTGGIISEIPAEEGTALDYCTNMLFIPQEIAKSNEQITIELNGKTYTGTLNHKIELQIRFYYGDTRPANDLVATVDLTAGGKIDEWKAGTKYTYTIGVYEYQVNANIEIEDWTHHTFEEELK